MGAKDSPFIQLSEDIPGSRMRKGNLESEAGRCKGYLSRRAVLKMGEALAGMLAYKYSHAMHDESYETTASKKFIKLLDSEGGRVFRVHEGKGSIGVRLFDFGKASQPSILLAYNIPPGCSEGVHTHRLNDKRLGSFDEFYYIVSGSGQMEIQGEIVSVTQGDNIFTPNGVSHGIENTSLDDLDVYLIAIRRD